MPQKHKEDTKYWWSKQIGTDVKHDFYINKQKTLNLETQGLSRLPILYQCVLSVNLLHCRLSVLGG